MRKIVCIIFLCGLVFAGCHPLFCVWDLGYTKIRKIGTPALTGFYTLDKHSLDQMKYEGNYTISRHTLELLPNGTYKFMNLADWVLSPFGDSKKSVITNEGKWSVQCLNPDGCEIVFDGFKDGLYGDLCAKNNRPAILISVGDPDGCIGLVYVKTN